MLKSFSQLNQEAVARPLTGNVANTSHTTLLLNWELKMGETGVCVCLTLTLGNHLEDIL